MEDIRIERVGKPDLTFTGDLIGQSAGENPLLRIYRTKAGKYVARLRHDSQRANTSVFEKPNDLVQWIGAQLGTISAEAQIAIEKARDADTVFQQSWTEHID